MAVFLRRLIILFGTYSAFGFGGILIGAMNGYSPSGSDLVSAAIFSPLLNAVPIIAGSVDQMLPITILCWLMFPCYAIHYVVSGKYGALCVVAITSLLMNISTLARFEAMMSV